MMEILLSILFNTFSLHTNMSGGSFCSLIRNLFFVKIPVVKSSSALRIESPLMKIHQESLLNLRLSVSFIGVAIISIEDMGT